MISVGSRDARRDLGLGLGLGFGVGRDMEETELEEGEACDYHDDDDTNIDPDVDLSYLDEKVQVVLGHHQKDFEGGVSAENLGARFGGYGSFLPTYQRSPAIWPQPRTPQKVQNYGTPRSPNNLLMEGDFQSTAVPIVGASSAKHGSCSNAAPSTVSRAPFLETSSKRDSSLLSARGTAECTLNNGPHDKSNTATDHKTLKVRLKVCSDNMAEKTAAIFSDLGFHSSSPEDSPVESGGFSPESRQSPDESPTSILQIMTSSPVPDGLLLSPLPTSFLHLTEKEKFFRDKRTSLAFRDSEGSSSILGDVPFSLMRDGKLRGEKKTKPMENSRLIETKNGIVNDVGDEMKNAFLHKEIDIETPEGRALVADSLKLPILSNPNILIGETAKSTGRASEASGETKKIKVKDKFFSSDRVKEDSESMTSQDVNKIEKLKFRTSSGNKVRDDRKEKGLGDKKEKIRGDQLEQVGKEAQSLSRKDGWSKGHKSYDSYKADFDDSKGRKELIDGTTDPSYNKVKVKAASLERDGGFPSSGIEQTFSEGRKKSKGSKSNGNSAVVSSQESLRVVTSAVSKDQIKSSHSSSKNKLDSKLCKESGKTRDIYKDFFGEDMDQAENTMNSPETPYRDRPTEYKLEVIEKENRHADKPMDRSSSKEIHQFADNSRERPNGKKVENSLTSGYQQATPIVAPSTGNGLVSDTVCATVAPLVIKENWVACDKCGKWRLLPCDRNTADLPKKWLCSMLDWLPGMSRCIVSEEETTRALYASYGLPPPDSQNNVDSLPNGTAAGVTLPEGQHLDLRHQDQNMLGVPSGGKKKHGLKETADVTSLTGPVHTSNSINKNHQAYLKSRNVNDVNHSPLDSNLANKGKSSDSAVEKHRHKRKDKHKLAQDGGVANQSKLKSKRDADQDGSKASKKIKTEGLFSNEEEWASDHGGFMGSSGPTLINGLSAKEAVKSMKKNGEYISSRESKFDMKDNKLSSAKEPRERGHVSVDVGVPDIGKLDRKGISAKKRKAQEWQENQVHPSEPFMEVDNHLEANKISFEGSSESELKKGKKARVLKSEERDSHKVMDDARTDKRDRESQILNSISRDFVTDEVGEVKGYVDKDLQQAQYRAGSMMSQQILDNVDPVKRDMGYGMPSLAATSSSSKVSGSHKSKANFQENKGSPVESVSSSPMRFSDGTSAKKVVLGKYDVNGTMGSLTKCSDGEGDGRGGHSGSARKEKSHSVVHHKSVESSMLDYHEVDPTSGVKAKALIEPRCNEFGNPHVVNGGSDTLDQRNQRVELLDKEYGHDDERMNKYNGSNGPLSRKFGKGSSSRSKEKHKGSKSDVDRGKIKVSDSFINQEELYPSKHFKNGAELEPQDVSHYHEESKGAKYSSQEKYGVKDSKDEKSCLGKKEYFGKWSDEGRREKQSKFGGNDGTDVKLNPACSKDGKSNAYQNSMKDRVGERSSHRSLSERPDQLNPAFGRGKSHSFPHSGDKQETQTRCPRPISSSHRGHGSELLPVDASSGGGGDDLKVAKHSRRPDNQAGGPHNNLRHSTPGRVGVGDLDGPSPFRKDSSSQTANNFLKEAKDLKHSADRLKNSGSDLDSTGLYFEAVLKFLHGASLLEPCNVESSRHGESQSVHIYSTTVGLCEFVAYDYERGKQMAAAALAYKCLEVAWMRVVYFRHTSINKDRNELQAALQMVPPGESPSSSASDVDNLNNQGTVDKVALAKGVGSPHVAGNHVIAAQKRPNFVRALNFIQDVNSAMEAYRKSKNAFAIASASLEESQYEGISAVKRALDYSFDDVQGLLRLVRLAKEAIRC
ncbi:Cw-type zinc finger [Thalictrum thalictroides]|uniref:Cw-type zinc finger n=1 Tax=Thalictrum thalictroides TaxID=46969 RepID=A0A7J6VAR7_THATH|nr:Cw-type zinc finger [Thalictrum thalictroides]